MESRDRQAARLLIAGKRLRAGHHLLVVELVVDLVRDLAVSKAAWSHVHVHVHVPFGSGG